MEIFPHLLIPFQFKLNFDIRTIEILDVGVILITPFFSTPIFREVIVGEHTLGNNPDCRRNGRFCLPEPQSLRVEKVDVHPQWNKASFQAGFDIALIRVRGSIKLFVSFFHIYHFLSLNKTEKAFSPQGSDENDVC